MRESSPLTQRFGSTREPGNLEGAFCEPAFKFGLDTPEGVETMLSPPVKVTGAGFPPEDVRVTLTGVMALGWI